MRIAIITYSRIYNYGSALQTYALNKYLTDLGHDVKTIDYAQPQQEKSKEHIFSKSKGLMSVIRNIQTLIYKKQLLQSREKFRDFYNDYVPKTKTITDKEELKLLENEFDLFICGSDQIWNTSYFGFDTSYLLSFVSDKRKCISYAASIGTSKLNFGDEQMFKEHLSDFKKIMVREKIAAKLLQNVVPKEVDVVMDPVFLVKKERWDELSIESTIQKPYALCYFIGNIEGMREKAQQLRKECKLPLIVIRINLRDWLGRYKRDYTNGPLEFLKLIKNAECVFTNSFHAIAFSIIFKKKFWAFSQDAHQASQSRIDNILSELNLENRKVYAHTQNVKWKEEIDFGKVNERLDKQVQQSKAFLDEALGG